MLEKLSNIKTLIPLIAVSIGIAYLLSDRILSLEVIEGSSELSLILWSVLVFIILSLMIAVVSKTKSSNEINVIGEENEVKQQNIASINQKTKTKGNKNKITQTGK